MNENRARIAVFIDVENVGMRAIPSVLEHLTVSWDPFIRRAYGSNLVGRQRILRANGITPIEVVPNTPGKNSSDHALIIDAMQELCVGQADAFCIVSGDSDFTQLALRIREYGKPVLVFGHQNTPLSLRKSCTEFYIVEGNGNPTNKKKKQPDSNARLVPRSTDSQLRDEMCRIFRGLPGDSGKTTIATFSSLVRQSVPGFSPKNYGSRNMTSLLRKLGVFELEAMTNNAGTVVNYELRLQRLPLAPDPEQCCETGAELTSA